MNLLVFCVFAYSLAATDAYDAFYINGAHNNDYTGYSVSTAGDINGDGIVDIIIGAPTANPAGITDAGIAYVLFGKDQTEDFSNVELSSLNDGATADGFAINGAKTNDFAGFSVGAVGDVNGDGIDDIIVGAYSSSPTVDGFKRTSAGVTYVLFGKSYVTANFTNIELSVLNSAATADGFAIYGAKSGDDSGWSVSGAGDVNGDGIADMLIGAPHADPLGNTQAGITYVLYGKSYAFERSNLDLSLLSNATADGFAVIGASLSDNCGNAVSAAGDVNGDGVDDVLIGAKGASANGITEAGSAYVIFGKSYNKERTNIELSSIVKAATAEGFAINGDLAGDHNGYAVSGAGDINGDGIADIIIGAPDANPNGVPDSGACYVLYGKSYNLEYENVNVSSFNDGATADGFAIFGASYNDYSGWSVGGAGDVNGDGTADMIIGAPYANPKGVTDAGITYVVYGKSYVESRSNIQLSTFADYTSDGFHFSGVQNNDYCGWSVGGAGDVNSDGFADVLIGAYGANPTGDSAQVQAGRTAVLFGKK